MADRDEILSAAMDSFQNGCSDGAGAAGYALASDCAAAVNAHYGAIYDRHAADITASRSTGNGKWTDALKTVFQTGREAARQAGAGARSGSLTVTAANFTAAAASVEKAHQQELESVKAPSVQEAGSGPCTWCD